MIPGPLRLDEPTARANDSEQKQEKEEKAEKNRHGSIMPA